MQFLRNEFLGHKNLSDLDDETMLIPFSFQHLEDGLKEEEIYYCNVGDKNKFVFLARILFLYPTLQ